MNQERYTYLLQGWLDQQLSQEEIDEFLDALQDDTFVDYVGKDIIESLNTGKFNHLETREEKEKALAVLMTRIASSQTAVVPPAGNSKIVWLKRMAAAAIFTGLCIIGYFIFTKKEHYPPVAIVQEKIGYPVINQAVITLPDGTQLRIDTISSSIVLSRYGIQIEKTPDGQLVYKSINSDQSFTALPVKIENPRGSTPLRVQLTDGSDVWLNAQSTITYPVIFATDKREVSITGEAYFEVAKDPAKKFIVSNSRLTTEVLGTHFNIKAYEDEPVAKVTLLEGSVKVYPGKATEGSKLVPEQQALVTDQQVQIITADIQHTMAWKMHY